MNLFQQFVNEYRGFKPKKYAPIASDLRAGKSARDVRSWLMEEEGFSRLAAAKMVEDVEKTISASKKNIFVGSALCLLAIAFAGLDPSSIGAYAGLLVGAAQATAGYKGWRSYQQAGRKEAA